MKDAYEHCDVYYLTTNINKLVAPDDDKVMTVMDADLTNIPKLIPLAFQVLYAVIRNRPDVIISTGAAPGFFAVAFGRIIGAKTIWIDSMANYSKLSVSGHYASKICHVCLTQWPNLADGKRIKHLGSLL